MTWAKLDDQLHADPRLLAAGLEAFGLYCAALSWMGAFLTDGEITAAQVKRIAGRKAAALAARLVEAGFWESKPGDKWGVISWETPLISRRQVEDNRARKSSAGRAGAERTNAKRLESGPAGAAASAGVHRAAPDPDPSRSRPDPEEDQTPKPPKGAGVSVAEIADGQPALPGFEPPPTPAAAIEDSIFAAYLEGRAAKGVKGPRPVLDARRRGMIRGRLAAGFTIEDLRAAAAGIWRSDWHVNEKRTGFELVVRDAAGVERFRDLAAEPEDGPDVPPDWPEAGQIAPPVWRPPPPDPPLDPAAEAEIAEMAKLSIPELQRRAAKARGLAGAVLR